MFCTNCGAENDDKDTFCTNCGQRLHASEEPAVSTNGAGMPQGEHEESDPATPLRSAQDDGSESRSAQDDGSESRSAQDDGITATHPNNHKVMPPNDHQTTPPNDHQTTPSNDHQTTPSNDHQTAHPQPVMLREVAASTNQRQHGLSKQVIIVLIVVALAACGGLAAFLTYQQGVWGGKIMPNPADFQPEASEALTADLVAKKLNDQGIPTKIKPMFSAQSKGEYIGLENVQPGERIPDDTEVIIKSSEGPGVPEGTVGTKGDEVTMAVKTLEDMGVDVHPKSVVVSEADDHPEGSIVVTQPGDGQPVEESQRTDGIYVGIATKGDGVPFDILGQDVDKTEQTLEDEGYSVTVSERPAAEQYVNKVAGSDPAPGSTLDSGKSVTLYKGADAKGVKDLLSTTSYDGSKMANMDLSALAGKYCKSEIKDPDKDCISFESINGGYAESGKELQRVGTSDEPLFLTNFSQDSSGAMLEADPEHGLSESALPLKNHLFLKDWGMFEFYPDYGQPNCGDTITSGGEWDICDNGTLRTINPDSAEWRNNENNIWDSQGWTYEMNDFFVYFPVGSDLDALEDSGYFDDESLAEAKKEKSVDSARPYILMRDPGLYDTTSVPSKGAFQDFNPFVPGNDNGKNPLVPMKPAPSDATVYYLVEDQTELDWDSLPDAELDGSDSSKSSDSSDSTDSSKSTAKPTTATPKKVVDISSFDEVKTATGKGDFSLVAGKYCTKANDCITLDAKGVVSKDPTYPDKGPSQLTLDSEPGDWALDTGSLHFAGPDSELQCKEVDSQGLETGGTLSGSDCMENYRGPMADIGPLPTNLLYVFKGADVSSWYGESGMQLTSDQSPANTDKPSLYPVPKYLKWAPADEDMYYLQDE